LAFFPSHFSSPSTPLPRGLTTSTLQLPTLFAPFGILDSPITHLQALLPIRHTWQNRLRLPPMQPATICLQLGLEKGE
jgi:hypothetical protein